MGRSERRVVLACSTTRRFPSSNRNSRGFVAKTRPMHVFRDQLVGVWGRGVMIAFMLLPQLFDLVIGPRIFLKQMDKKAISIQNNPLSVIVSSLCFGAHSVLFACVLHSATQGPQVSR